MRRIFVLLLIAFIYNNTFSQTQVYDLNGKWLFGETLQKTEMIASVPGNVFVDLYNNKKIPHPYYADNEQKVQWVSKKNWIYTKEFNLDKDFLKNKQIYLIFEGLDTYANVYLNDSLVLRADNMFRKWEISVRKFVKKYNTLKIEFQSPIVTDSIKALQIPYKFPDNRAFTRKAPYQYGWDWGPRLVGIGIWKNVYLQAFNQFRVKDIYIRQDKVSVEKADVTAIIEIEALKNMPVTVEISDSDKKLYKRQRFNLRKGVNTLSMKYEIQNPRLWFPNGYGKQELYTFNFLFATMTDKYEKKITTGLRNIKLITRKDSIGSTFYFEVNGKPVFAKGANYIPQDNFPSQVPDYKYVNLIKDAASSNMNMLRVWGGGIYERDTFYSLCDKYGIMVWQDFMFACNFYPGDSAFLENVGMEADYQIKRLRNHPSLALFCGNNEIDEAWHNWGYQKALNYSKNDSVTIWNDYLKLFEKILPQKVHSLTNISYIPTSPKIGWGHKEALYSGDMHYWGVWWGAEPFEIYPAKTGRFMSEYGFQAFPDYRTLQQVLDKEDMNLQSKALLNHQKHPRGMQLIREYMQRDFPVPDKPDDYIYVSQLVQAEGIGLAIEAHRRKMPYCMGTLYWQYNDSWPVISWSSRDYYGRWKFLQFKVGKLYENLIVSGEKNSNIIKIYTVSDYYDDFNAKIKVKLMSFGGDILYTDSQKIVVKHGSHIQKTFDTDIIPPNYDKSNTLLYVEIIDNTGKIITTKIIYFDKPKKLNLSNVKPLIMYLKSEDYVEITIKSESLIKNLFLYCENADGKFSDNFLDILPDVEYKIKFYPKNKNNIEKINFKYKSLNDFIQ